ncbi:MAG TPA: anti-sigma factor [Terracidiphilus sp.]|nr:anti-sigma factor [Terracidiphilus sp.]
MTDARHISPEDLTLYAMQALAANESAAARTHLAECAQCREQLASINGDLALVALSVDQQPLPAGARARFLAKLAPTADQAPVVSIASNRASRAAVFIPWLAVAALLVLSVSLGVQVQRLTQQIRSVSDQTARLAIENARAQEVLEILSAPAAQRVVLTGPMPPRPLPTGRAVYLPARGGLIFQGNNLARLADDKTYELWVIPANGSAPIPAGLFRPDEAGNASVVLPPLPVGVPAKAFGITIEKAGGSATPTAPIVLSGAAPASGE